jgi:hypothetical protein
VKYESDPTALPPVTGNAFVVLHGDWLALARRAVLLAEHDLRRNGLPASAYGQLIEALTAALAADGRKTVASQPEPTQWLTTTQVARELHCSQRQARRIAARCGHRVGGRWVIPADALQEGKQ